MYLPVNVSVCIVSNRLCCRIKICKLAKLIKDCVAIEWILLKPIRRMRKKKRINRAILAINVTSFEFGAYLYWELGVKSICRKDFHLILKFDCWTNLKPQDYVILQKKKKIKLNFFKKSFLKKKQTWKNTRTNPILI